MNKIILFPLLATLSLFAPTLVANDSPLEAKKRVEHSYFSDGTSVSREFHYQGDTLTDVRVFSLSGKNTAWIKWKKLDNGHWLREGVDPEVGFLKSREEIILNPGVKPRDASLKNILRVKEWVLSKRLEKIPTTVEIFTDNPKLPSSKLILKIGEDSLDQVHSRINYFYKKGADRPYAFEEIKDGVVISDFQLYEDFDPEGVWEKSDLSEEEISKRRQNLNQKDKFLVAIIDSGFDYNHIDLAHHWYMNNLDPLDGIDNDGNGWVDDFLGWEREQGVGLPTESSTKIHDSWRPMSHGTHVAHIAVRDLWGVGLIGFAGDYTNLDYLKRISRFLKDHQVKVVNMSLGLPADIRNLMGLRDTKYILQDMVKDNPQTLFIVAAGNSEPGVNIDDRLNFQYPANIKGNNIITVGSTNSSTIDWDIVDDYSLANFSNFGNQYVDILAPGQDVVAASLGGGEIAHSGTSMATPYMVNEVVRLWQKFPEFSAAEIKGFFLKSAYRLPSAPLVKTEGLVNYQEAINLAKEERMKRRWDEARSMTLDQNGPNCWNSALYLSGIVNEIREVPNNEFRSVIESQRCQEVAEPITGDIVALRRTGAEGRPLKYALHSEVHAYTYQDEDNGLTKNGFSKKAPYIEQTHNQIYHLYKNVNRKDCRILGVPKEYCHLNTFYYRCL